MVGKSRAHWSSMPYLLYMYMYNVHVQCTLCIYIRTCVYVVFLECLYQTTTCTCMLRVCVFPAHFSSCADTVPPYIVVYSLSKAIQLQYWGPSSILQSIPCECNVHMHICSSQEQNLRRAHTNKTQQPHQQ